MSNYFFRDTSLRTLIQDGAQNFSVPAYNINMTYLQATADYQKITTLPYQNTTNTSIGNDLTGSTTSIDATTQNGSIPIPTWANHYKYNFLGKGGAQGATGSPGGDGHANSCPMGQAKRSRPGGPGGPGGAGGPAYAIYAPLTPIQLPNDKSSAINYAFDSNKAVVSISPSASITINSGAQGNTGAQGNNGSNACQGGPGNIGAPGNQGAAGNISNPNSIPGTQYNTNIVRSTSRFEVYFFKI